MDYKLWNDISGQGAHQIRAVLRVRPVLVVLAGTGDTTLPQAEERCASLSTVEQGENRSQEMVTQKFTEPSNRDDA